MRALDECCKGGLLVGKGGSYGSLLWMGPPLTLTDDEARERLGHPGGSDPHADAEAF